MTDPQPPVERLAAFTDDPSGGNPAGVVLGDELPDEARMRRIAADVGYSETAFLADRGEGAFTVRYFAPEAEVPFCGHATIASGVLLGQRRGEGRYRFFTRSGEVTVDVEVGDSGIRAALTSVAPDRRPAERLGEVLACFGWTADDLDPDLPAEEAFAGAWHLVLALRERATLRAMDYDFGALRGIMADRGLTTVQVVWREAGDRFHARNPFPVGGVVEDPATGAAAAALGGYLRAQGLVEPPVSVTVLQGEDMGRPSLLRVDVPVEGGIRVSGTAVAIGG